NFIPFSDLVKEGCQFEVDLRDNRRATDDFLGHVSDDSDFEDATDVDSEKLLSPWTRTFDELRCLMNRVNDFLYKRVTREGHLDREVVPERARVAVRYSGYWEGEGAPFDSSLLRGTKFEFITGQCQVIEGLEAAVLTMRPYEQAEFIISYKLLFRELGCPPRIKPKADGLFRVEVIDYSLIGDAEAVDGIAKEDRDKFCVVYPKAQEIHLHAKDCVKRGRFYHAASSFEKAVNSLNYCRLANEKEEEKQTQMLITLYQNLMICYNKINKPQRVCIVMKAVRRLTENNPSCKALFQEGRALSTLGEYEQARISFLKAQKMQPSNHEINNEILNLESRITKYKDASRDLWTRALSSKKDQPKATDTDPIQDDKDKAFAKDIEEMIEQFKNSARVSTDLSRSMYTDKQFEIFRHLVKDRDMKLTLSPIQEDLLTLSKLSIE
ncbi:hypothetical protein KR074_008682, partial [Drosophila pseudoananassae]